MKAFLFRSRLELAIVRSFIFSFRLATSASVLSDTGISQVLTFSFLSFLFWNLLSFLILWSRLLFAIGFLHIGSLV